jgi:hypothetical protein
VASLLAAAEEAAAQILHEANHEAEAIRADARGEAARFRDQAVSADTGGGRKGIDLGQLAARAAFSHRVQYRALRVIVSSSWLVLATVLMFRVLDA